MSRPRALSFVLMLACACTDDDPGGRTDATVSSDATATDATASDATAPDATAPDATAPDATAPDATAPDAEPADGGFDCGALGLACGPANACPTGMRCVDPQNICLPDRSIDCGGFTHMMCPGTHPVCLYFQAADYGPCFTAEEQSCVCTQPGGQAAFPDC